MATTMMMPDLPPPYTPRKVSPLPKYAFLNIPYVQSRNRSLSLRSKNRDGGSSEGGGSSIKHKFGLGSMRASTKPELSKRLFRLIKSENHVINSHDQSGREQISIASQLSDWGQATNDDGVSDISDKVGVLLSELGETEIRYGHNLEDFRTTLKHIRNTEASVQPSRDKKHKITDEIAKLKYKEPQSTKIVQLEQELVRAEAENLVAEAQLTNITRQKLKEAYAVNFAAVIERAEKQAILAKHGRRLLNLLDDTPVVPGDVRPTYDLESEARAILNEAEVALQNWSSDLEEVTSNAHLDPSLMPTQSQTSSPIATHHHQQPQQRRTMSGSSSSSSEYAAAQPGLQQHQQQQQQSTFHGTGEPVSATSMTSPPYPTEGSARVLEPVPIGGPNP